MPQKDDGRSQVNHSQEIFWVAFPADHDAAIVMQPRKQALDLLAHSFTMCQTVFTVMPSPHVLPTLSTRRNSFPRSIETAVIQSSSSGLTHSGTVTVRTWHPLPTRSTMAQCSARCWR